MDARIEMLCAEAGAEVTGAPVADSLKVLRLQLAEEPEIGILLEAVVRKAVDQERRRCMTILERRADSWLKGRLTCLPREVNVRFAEATSCAAVLALTGAAEDKL